MIMRAFERMILLFLALCLLPAQAMVLDDRDRLFVHGNIEFVVLHELAHLLLNELEVPVIGPQEHAADYLATIALIRPDQVNPERTNRVLQYVSAVMYGFAGAWDLDKPDVNQLPYWDNHSLTIQRFYNVGCLLYGSNPETFPRIPAVIGLPERRASQCRAEYDRAYKAVAWLVSNYGRKETGVTPEIAISYGAAETVVSRQVIDSVRQARVIEKIVNRFSRYFALTRPITVITRDCRMRQAYWSEEDREIVLCHELFNYFLALARNTRVNELIDNDQTNNPRG